jgi:hypothetical protein
VHSSSPPFVLHALPISSSLTLSFQLYLAKSISYKVSHYAVFFQPSTTSVFSSDILLSTLFWSTLS